MPPKTATEEPSNHTAAERPMDARPEELSPDAPPPAGVGVTGDEAQALVEAIERNAALQLITDGIEYLRETGRDPMRLWKAKAPKGAGEVIAVLCQDCNEVMLIHQRVGRFTIYESVD